MTAVLVTAAAQPLRAQSSADSVAAVAALLDRTLEPAYQAHYMGAPPYEPYHPDGSPEAYCLAFTLGPSQERRPLRTADLARAVHERIERWFELDGTERCELPESDRGGPAGLVDANGARAIEVQIGVRFDSATRGIAHFALNPGRSLGLVGWRCGVARDEGGVWRVDEERCAFYES